MFTFAQNGDEGQDEHDVAAGPVAEPRGDAAMLLLLGQGLGDLDLPLLMDIPFDISFLDGVYVDVIFGSS